ncbi:MAG: tetratricopeptide repeat protein, partial [Verrucomicrobiae bacterium]|nr:tetratricopeptide repeat protein [Verrucomicrobiae bacterium]
MTGNQRKLPGRSLLFIALWLTVPGSPVFGQATLEKLTFKDALESCIQAVGSGDLVAAADQFQSLETSFGSEEEYQAAESQRRILPLKAISELGAGRHPQAAATFETLQLQFPEVISNNAALLYGLAQANRGAGNLAGARDALTLYIQRFSGTAEAGLAFLERADLFFEENLLEEGLSSLAQFYDSAAPGSLKMQGQLKAVQACLDNGFMDRALDLMLLTSWSVTTMPELAQLTFSALRCGEYAMSQANYTSALKLFYLVPPKTQLLHLQKEKLEELESRILSGRRRALLANNSHQQTYLSYLKQKLTQQLEALENGDDYTPTFYLRYGQCLLFDAQFHKAWLAFEYIALNEDYPDKVREEAHYRWVVCAHQLEDWEEALTIARNFVERYPDSPLAPSAFYLIAKAHLEQRRYAESIEVLSDLIEHFPDHALYGRWLFTRGFNQIVLEQYDLAREDFRTYEEKLPEGRLIINIRLWNALTHFFEKDYAHCIEELEELATIDQRHPLYPEILYRLASAHYSAREHDAALTRIDEFLEGFSRHQRVQEARVLKGDILMGKGELDEAIASFQSVTPDSPDLFLYGLFQIGKILRAQEEYEQMTAHFRTFIDDDSLPRIRISEALYWLGWAYQQQDRIDLAYPVYEEALADYGNDPQAGETQSILLALERLKRGQKNLPARQDSALSKTPDFSIWLTDEIARAETSGSLTYLSRLTLFRCNRFPKTTDVATSFANLADEVPLDKLDPEALGKVGLVLLDRNDPRAENFFNFLIEAFPQSKARAMAYLGLARLAMGKEDFETARKWLEQSEDNVPMHEHRNESQLLLGEVLTELSEYETSIETYENLLRMKSARGRPHAAALNGIAENYRRQGNTEKAIAYYQRIYNMYRAFPELVVRAYVASADLFESLNRIPEAVNTLKEMLKQNQLSAFPEWSQAEARLPKLIQLLPPELE